MVLITGGAGYIGSILTTRLLQEGYPVTVIDNLMYQQKSLLHCFSYPQFSFIKGDAGDRALLKKTLNTHEYVVPLAAIVGAPACDQNPQLAHRVNIETIDTLLAEIKPHHKILYPNTNSGYGVGKENIYCTEESLLNPISLYGKQKVEVEKKMLETGQAISFRLATVFGVSSRMRLDLLVNDFTHKAVFENCIVLFEEHFKRNFIHIQDVANAFLFGIKKFTKMQNQVYNIGDSRINISKKELCEKIKEQVPSLFITTAPLAKDPDKRNYIVSNDKIEALGWKSQKTIDEGVKELLMAFEFLKTKPFSNV